IPIEFTGLILEDDAACADVVARVMQRAGGKTIVCETIASARRALKHHQFDLFILDYMMPDGTGSAFYYELREQGFLAPAIMRTGLPDLATAIQLTRNGLYDYLTKPFEVQQLLDCLHRAMLLVTYPEPDESFLNFVGHSGASKEVRRLVQH